MQMVRAFFTCSLWQQHEEAADKQRIEQNKIKTRFPGDVFCDESTDRYGYSGKYRKSCHEIGKNFFLFMLC
jgi:hypothetical protein